MSDVDTETRSTARQEYVRAQQRVFDRYGVEVESRFVRTPALTGDTHVLASGEGPPLVMVIGGGMVAGLFAPLMAHLDGYRIYAMDPPGHGLTASTGFSEGAMRELAVGFLSEVLDGLGLKEAPFVSQSLGGLWTSWLAIDRPDRVSSISYVACPALMLGTSAPLPLRIATIPVVGDLINVLDRPSQKQVMRMGRMAGEDLSDVPELRDLFLAYERMPGARARLGELHRALIRLRGPRPGVELTARQLSRIRSPIQMIWGEDDPFGPPSTGKRAARVLPGASLHVVPGGHGPWFHHAETIASLIRSFLEGDT